MSMGNQLLGPLREYTSKVGVMLKMASEAGGGKVAVRQQPFAQTDKVQTVVAETYRVLKTRKCVIQKSMSLYLANRDTEYILFRPIKVILLLLFVVYSQLLLSRF